MSTFPLFQRPGRGRQHASPPRLAKCTGQFGSAIGAPPFSSPCDGRPYQTPTIGVPSALISGSMGDIAASATSFAVPYIHHNRGRFSNFSVPERLQSSTKHCSLSTISGWFQQRRSHQKRPPPCSCLPHGSKHTWLRNTLTMRICVDQWSDSRDKRRYSVTLLLLLPVLSYLGSSGFSNMTLKIFQMIALLMTAHGKSVVLVRVFDEGNKRAVGTCNADVVWTVVGNSLEISRHDGQAVHRLTKTISKTTSTATARTRTTTTTTPTTTARMTTRARRRGFAGIKKSPFFRSVRFSPDAGRMHQEAVTLAAATKATTETVAAVQQQQSSNRNQQRSQKKTKQQKRQQSTKRSSKNSNRCTKSSGKGSGNSKAAETDQQQGQQSKKKLFLCLS